MGHKSMDWPPVLTGGRYGAEGWKAATGEAPGEAFWSGGLGRTCDMGAALHGPRPELACDVPWCVNAAAVSWQRTPAEIKKMKRGPIKVEPVRQVCVEHAPRWRADVYAPVGQTRKVEAPAAVTRKAPPARTSAPAPVVEALLDELAATRSELESARRKLEAHGQTWKLYREALAELAALRAAKAPEPADLLAELVAAPLAGDPFAAMVA